MPHVVLITGASSGLGQSIAEYLSEKGMRVYGTSRNPKEKKSSSFKMLALDVTDVTSIKKAIEAVIKAEGKLDVLINNAGMGITGPIEDTPTGEMRKVFNTNLFGAIDMMKGVLPQMRNQGSGLIINITSIAGYMGLPFRGIYSATKGALELVTEAIRMEVKDAGIKVTTIAPGDFATNIAAGRYHTPVFEDSPYKEKYSQNLAMIDADVDRGRSPEEMAHAVFRIIKTTNPKGHYKVGSFLEKFSIVLKRLLPDIVYEKILMNHYKL